MPLLVTTTFNQSVSVHQKQNGQPSEESSVLNFYSLKNKMFFF